MADIRTSGSETGSIVALMGRAQAGDRGAFDELERIGEERGHSFVEGWSSHMLVLRLQDRSSQTNLLAREGIKRDLEATVAALSSRADGPIERLIVERSALCLVDAQQADLEHIGSVRDASNQATVEALDRRRDRAHRRLLLTLKTLCEVRRLNRPAIRVNVGDGNMNVLEA